MNRLPALRPHIGRVIAGYTTSLPQPGFFKLRLVRQGPWVPAIIWQPCPMIEPEPLEATSDPADWCHPTDPWRGPRWLRARIGDDEADPLEVWMRGKRITAAEYHHRVALAAWATVWKPDEAPEANPRAKVDLTKQAALF